MAEKGGLGGIKSALQRSHSLLTSPATHAEGQGRPVMVSATTPMQIKKIKNNETFYMELCYYI